MGTILSHTKTFRFIYFAVVAFYCLVIARFGFENWDTGYISSFSWRIVNGQVPYSDFIYKGPPVSLYFHALFMGILPETGQFYLFRVIGYLLFAVQIYFVVSAANKIYQFQNAGFDKWALMTVGFTVSLLNFSAYPWPTTDGLLFASIAFYTMSRSTQNTWTIFLTALFCLLSALTKQSFYPIPLIFALWILIEYGFRRTMLFMTFTIILFACFWTFVGYFSSWEEFLIQTTGETHFKDLVYVGFHEYKSFFLDFIVLIITIAAAIALSFLRPDADKNKFFAVITWLPIVVFFTAIGYCFFDILIASRIAFVSCAIALLLHFRFSMQVVRHLSPAAVILSIAWCSSISFGYSFPVFYATGIILVFIILEERKLRLLFHRKYLMIPAIAVVLFAVAYNYRPYRESPLPELNASLNDVSPKLRFMLTAKPNVEKHLELKSLIAKYGEDFIVAPAMPASNYIFNDQSELPADWIINTEVNRRYQLFTTLASHPKNYIFVEKSFLKGEEMSLADRNESSIITMNIIRDFRRIGETKHFIVFNSLK